MFVWAPALAFSAGVIMTVGAQIQGLSGPHIKTNSRPGAPELQRGLQPRPYTRLVQGLTCVHVTIVAQSELYTESITCLYLADGVAETSLAPAQQRQIIRAA